MQGIKAVINRSDAGGSAKQAGDRHRGRKRMTTLIGAAIAAVAIGAVGVAFASPGATYFVATTGDNANNCTDSSTPCLTITAAVTKASSGDTIQVAAGTYNENLTLNKSLTINGPNASVAALSGTSRGAEAVIGATGNTNPRVTVGTTAVVSIAGLKFVGPTSGSAVGVQVSGSTTSGEIKNNWFYKLSKPNVSASNSDIYIQNGSPSGWNVTGNLHDGSGNWPDDAPTYGWTAINAWSVSNAEISGNLIRNYERGIQTEGSGTTQTGVVIKSNRIENTVYHAIQAANQNVGTRIIGNTIDKSQLVSDWASLSYGDDGGLDWCTGAIRIWANSTSSGFVVENNKITNTGGDSPGWCPSIGVTGTDASAISSIKDNSVAGSGNTGFAWAAVQVAYASLTSNVVTLQTTSSNALVAGDSVTVSGVGAPFDGTYTVASKPTSSKITYAKTASNVSIFRTAASTDPTVIKSSQVGAIALGRNWWGAAYGPGATGASLKLGATAVTATPWTVSYSDGSADAGFDGSLGFWPSSVVSGTSPSNSAVPTLSGTVRVGQTLTSTDGTWSGSPTPTYSYKWQRSDTASGTYSDISGAISATYELTSSDFGKYVRSVVTGTNAAGSASANSAASTQVAALATSTSVESSGAINRGQSATFTVRLTPSSATGTVTVKDGSTTIGTCTLSSGTCTVTKKFLIVGGRTITAEYAASAHFAASTSSSITQTVNSASSSIDVAPSGGDYSTIQAAVDAADAGDTIQVAAGTYNENLTLN
ncbi:MAG: Ig-like domain repeat protein, partial [Actinomycetes bacterium]